MLKERVFARHLKAPSFLYIYLKNHSKLLVRLYLLVRLLNATTA